VVGLKIVGRTDGKEIEDEVERKVQKTIPCCGAWSQESSGGHPAQF